MVPVKLIVLLPSNVVKPEAPHAATPAAVELSHVSVTPSLCSCKNESALAVGLTATSSAVDPNTVSSGLNMFSFLLLEWDIRFRKQPCVGKRTTKERNADPLRRDLTPAVGGVTRRIPVIDQAEDVPS